MYSILHTLHRLIRWWRLVITNLLAVQFCTSLFIIMYSLVSSSILRPIYAKLRMPYQSKITRIKSHSKEQVDLSEIILSYR
jgi:hypothetical protein